MGPIDFPPSQAKGVPDHPHIEFETLRYIVDGVFEHKDSQGNRGILRSGDVQWITAGSGIFILKCQNQNLQKRVGNYMVFIYGLISPKYTR